MAENRNLIFSAKIPQKTSQPLIWTGLTGCGDSLALASAIKQENRLFVIVTPDNQTALRLEHELAFFLQKEHPILHFPDWETLPYDVFSPLPDIISERLKTLALLPQVKRGALVVSVATLMHRLAPREHVLANSFSITVGDRFNLELNRIKLESVGYQCVSQVYQHGEFAVRGSIVDLFPMGSKTPYRIELFDEDIESIRTFDPETQLSVRRANSPLPTTPSSIFARPSGTIFPRFRKKIRFIWMSVRALRRPASSIICRYLSTAPKRYLIIYLSLRYWWRPNPLRQLPGLFTVKPRNVFSNANTMSRGRCWNRVYYFCRQMN